MLLEEEDANRYFSTGAIYPVFIPSNQEKGSFSIATIFKPKTFMSRQRYSYTSHTQFPVGIPFVNIHLSNNATTITVPAVVDSGAALNILPYDIGLSLNLNWDNQTYPLDLGGVLTGTQAYAVLLQAEIDSFPRANLAFAWVNKPSTEVRVLLGQVNFFFKSLMFVFMVTKRLLR